jgi:galactofuranose transport system ATP-binding protein
MTTTQLDGHPVVQMSGVSVHFPGVKALDDVDFRLFPGEIHALLGENGAGKSTLIKTLSGVYHPNHGSIRVNDLEQRFPTPASAQTAGISTVHQEVHLCPNLSVAENVMLGQEPRRGTMIDWRATRRLAREYLSQLNLDIDPASVLGGHSIAVQQLVAIARAMVIDARVLILDEPTSSLDTDEVERLFTVMRTVRERQVAILFVSHFIEQVYAVSDRMTILRNGRLVGEYLARDLPRVQLVSKMIGASVDVLDQLESEPARQTRAADDTVPLLSARKIGRKGSISPFDLDVRPGEIIGFAGLLGSGRTESARLLFGADRPDTGEMKVKGRSVRIRSPRRALRHKIAFSSESRRTEGLVGDLSVRENIILGLQAKRGWLRRIPRRRTNARPTRRSSSATSPVGTNRRCCSPGGWPWILNSSSSTSRPGGSTSEPRPRSNAWCPTSPPGACRWCSSPPSWRRSCA